MKSFALIFAAYFLIAGFGLITGGLNGLQKVNRFLIRLSKNTLGWCFDQFGNGLKVIGKAVRK